MQTPELIYNRLNAAKIVLAEILNLEYDGINKIKLQVDIITIIGPLTFANPLVINWLK